MKYYFWYIEIFQGLGLGFVKVLAVKFAGMDFGITLGNTKATMMQ